jgi:hypothetical protein
MAKDSAAKMTGAQAPSPANSISPNLAPHDNFVLSGPIRNIKDYTLMID